MNIDHYHKFRECEEKGLKKEASKSLRAFISSFEGNEDVEQWVWKYLPTLKTNRHSRIRHEIFHELVFPALREGFHNNDFACILWLGKLSQNVYQSPSIHKELGWTSEIELYEKCHELSPENDEARLLLLKSVVSWLAYTEHEWPSGILYGNDGATIQQCDEISLVVQKVIGLDKEHRHSEFIKQYHKKLSQYRVRLNKANHCDR